MSPSVYNTVVNNLSAGTNLFEWTITNGACVPTRDTVSIFRQLLATADFTWELNGLLVQFTSTATNASTYQWSFGDGSTSTERNPIHLYTVFRSFRVAHSASNTCGTAYKTHRLNPLGSRPMMEITPTVVDFGNVQVGNSATRMITVFNGGTDSLDVESILADASIAHAMSIKDQGFIVPPNSRKDVLIQFTPPSGGHVDGQIVVAGFDTSTSIRVLAKVTDLTLLKSGFLLPNSFAFGHTEPGTRARGVITLGNTTGQPLRIDSIRIAGNSDEAFSIEGILIPKRLEKKAVDGETSPIPSVSQWDLAPNDTLGICARVSSDGPDQRQRFIAHFCEHRITNRSPVGQRKRRGWKDFSGAGCPRDTSGNGSPGDIFHGAEFP